MKYKEKYEPFEDPSFEAQSFGKSCAEDTSIKM